MNFLVDVNASGAVARILIQLEHNVVEVGQKDPRMSDDEILIRKPHDEQNFS